MIFKPTVRYRAIGLVQDYLGTGGQQQATPGGLVSKEKDPVADFISQNADAISKMANTLGGTQNYEVARSAIHSYIKQYGKMPSETQIKPVVQQAVVGASTDGKVDINKAIDLASQGGATAGGYGQKDLLQEQKDKGSQQVIEDERAILKKTISDIQAQADLNVEEKRKATTDAIQSTEDAINAKLAELRTSTQEQLYDPEDIAKYTSQAVDPQVEKLRSILGEQATESEKILREGLAARGMLEGGQYGEQLGKQAQRRETLLGQESQDILTEALGARRSEILGKEQQERGRLTGQEARKIAREMGLEESDIARIYGTESRDVGLGEQFYGEDYSAKLLGQQQEREDKLLSGERAYQKQIRDEDYQRQLALQEALSSQQKQPSLLDTLGQTLLGAVGGVGSAFGGKALFDLLSKPKDKDVWV